MNKEQEEAIIKMMTERGWTCDVNVEDHLGFIFYEDEKNEWIRDYDKKTGSYCQYNGKQKVNLYSRKDKLCSE